MTTSRAGRWATLLALALVPGRAAGPPEAETFSYTVEWRLIHAGNARLEWKADGERWRTKLYLESVGLVSRLFKVNNTYSSVLRRELCVESSLLQANEGSRRHETRVTFDRDRKKVRYEDRDLVKKSVVSYELDVDGCQHDVIGALYALRQMKMRPGESVQLPISDGKKTVMARVEAQERETVKTDAGKFQTIRYEAFLFNNVLYRRRGRLFVWLTDDEKKIPVQIRVRLPFYVGTITLQLDKKV